MLRVAINMRSIVPVTIIPELAAKSERTAKAIFATDHVIVDQNGRYGTNESVGVAHIVHLIAALLGQDDQDLARKRVIDLPKHDRHLVWRADMHTAFTSADHDAIVVLRIDGRRIDETEQERGHARGDDEKLTQGFVLR